jgi:Na+-transporting NADH:ubiquinone oxidoreductase subunit C
MKSYSNTYIFIFSTIMVIIVALLLSFVAEQLRPIQEKNIEVEKKLDILRSVGQAAEVHEVKEKDSYVEEEYNKYITRSYVIDINGERQEGVDAFGVDMKVELARDPGERNLPIFVYTAADSAEKFIIPLRGTGLWGPIWGYVSFKDDLNSLYGAIFAHAKETPGLGAEIDQSWFQAQFVDKKIFSERGEFVSIKVQKGGADPEDEHAVDAISGGTITSVALQDMLENCLINYESYFKSLKDKSDE